MDPFGQKIITPQAEAWHTEQRRKQYDIIRVKNPTSEDFFVEYDTNQHQRIPANSTIDIPRYIATRYVEHMKDQIIHSRAQKMHDDFIAERRKKGFPDYKDKATENAETYETSVYPKTNDPKLIAEIFSDLWVGIVYEFGHDKLPTNSVSNTQVDMTSASQKVLNEIGNKRVDVTDTPIHQFQAIPTPPPSVSQPEATQPTGFAAMLDKLDESEVTVE